MISTQFVNKREAERLTGFSYETLKKYRLSGLLIENIHWIKFNSRVVRYNAPLLLDFLQNRNDPQAHQRAIESYQTTLPSNQRKSRRGLYHAEKAPTTV